jgi:hypothetical protein
MPEYLQVPESYQLSPMRAILCRAGILPEYAKQHSRTWVWTFHLLTTSPGQGEFVLPVFYRGTHLLQERLPAATWFGHAWKPLLQNIIDYPHNGLSRLHGSVIRTNRNLMISHQDHARTKHPRRQYAAD